MPPPACLVCGNAAGNRILVAGAPEIAGPQPEPEAMQSANRGGVDHPETLRCAEG